MPLCSNLVLTIDNYQPRTLLDAATREFTDCKRDRGLTLRRRWRFTCICLMGGCWLWVETNGSGREDLIW